MSIEEAREKLDKVRTLRASSGAGAFQRDITEALEEAVVLAIEALLERDRPRYGIVERGTLGDLGVTGARATEPALFLEPLEEESGPL